jgi:hypothetical protein
MVAPRTSPDRPEACIGLPLEDNRYPDHDKEGTDARDASTTDTIPSISPSMNSQTALEERVQELEEKLATLSLLLTRSQWMRPISPPPVTPPASPPTVEEQVGRTPVLESPAPMRPSLDANGQHRRNLSFRVLHCGDASPSSAIQAEIEDAQNDVAVGDEIFLPQTLSEDLPLTPERRKLEQKTFSLSPISKSPEEKQTEVIEEPPPLKKATNDPKSKWLDYLNNFQESNYDTDKQMEEFVKVPSAVESLLSFGFWVCVDSFLYILTILPIRFVWSSLLFIRYVAILLIRGEVADGPFRFHRR